jgi:hypothetical protein
MIRDLAHRHEGYGVPPEVFESHGREMLRPLTGFLRAG